jgi:hypothetical protein
VGVARHNACRILERGLASASLILRFHRCGAASRSTRRTRYVEAPPPRPSPASGRGGRHTSAFSRRISPELCISFRPQIKRAQGMPGAGWHPRSRVQIALVVAHTSIQVQPEQPGIPCAMVLRLIPSSPWRRIPFASIAGGLKVLRNPVGFLKTSAGLTPATGARTTRLCRPLFTPFVGARPSLMSKLTLRRRVARPACRGHRSPHPTSVTIAIRPSRGRGMAGFVRVIWGKREAEYF